MTITLPTTLPTKISAPGADVAARFTRDVLPLVDVLSRGAHRLARTDAQAEDLLQDTLLRAYTGFHNFQEGSNVQAWLFRILHNKWISTYRARQCRPIETTEEAITDRVLARTGASGTVSAEDEALRALPDTDISAALASLPEGFAEVLHLALVEGHTYAETAEILDIPLGTVMSRVSRGKQRLRLALAHRAPRPPMGDRDSYTARDIA